MKNINYLPTKYRTVFYNDLLYFLKNGGFINDNLELSNSMSDFTNTFNVLHKTFDFIGNIQIIRVKKDEVVKGPEKTGISRKCLPLTLPHPRNSSGVWTEGTKVSHFAKNNWSVFDISFSNHVFNYSSSDLFILMIDHFDQK